MNKVLVLLPALAWAGLACGSSGASGEQPPPPSPVAADVLAGPPVVMGTVIEASSGKPVEGAVVRAPDGTETTTDAEGRFRLKGLAHGTQGPLTATLGLLRGTVQLRPLEGGRLEVVLHLH